MDRENILAGKVIRLLQYSGATSALSFWDGFWLAESMVSGRCVEGPEGP